MSDEIKVAVRLRPLLPKDIAEKKTALWGVDGMNKIFPLESERRGTFSQRYDRVFGMDENNSNVYEELLEPLVLSAVNGFNVTIFAYGQTASGKTHTMLGNVKEPGVIHMAIDGIFSTIENTPDREYLLRIAYMEIYNENISDLLDTGKDKKSLKVVDRGSDNIVVQHLIEQTVTTKEQILQSMTLGEKQRHFGSTNMNEHSSRSHAIFRIIIESRMRRAEEDADGAVQVSHLNLVDLAGSEKAGQTGATGERFKEGCAINTSLLALSVVIKKLSEGDSFVSFRDSKLTHILRNSLGGNAKTAIICAVTPTVYDETMSTLNFASRAKAVKNEPHVNEILNEQALLKRYASTIRKLEKQLQHNAGEEQGAAAVEDMRRLLSEKESKIRELKEQLVVSSHAAITVPKDDQLRLRRMTWGGPGLKALSAKLASNAQMDISGLLARPSRSEDMEMGFTEASLALSSLREEDEEDFPPNIAMRISAQKTQLSLKPRTVETAAQTDFPIHTPILTGTPVPVLRRRVVALQDTVNTQLVEYNQLAEFTRLEKDVGIGKDSLELDRRVKELTAEVEQMRKTASDTAGLLLEAQKELSLHKDLVKNLTQQTQDLDVKKREAERTVEHLEPLLAENRDLRKSLDEKQRALNLLERDKLDWEVRVERNAENYKKKEGELKALVQEAWDAASADSASLIQLQDLETRIIELESQLTINQEESAALRTKLEASSEFAIRVIELECLLETSQKESRDLRAELHSKIEEHTQQSTEFNARFVDLQSQLDFSRQESTLRQHLEASANVSEEIVPTVGNPDSLALVTELQDQLHAKESEVKSLRLELENFKPPCNSGKHSLANEMSLTMDGSSVKSMEETILADVTVPQRSHLKRKTMSLTPHELLSQTLASLNASIFGDSPLEKKSKLPDTEEEVDDFEVKSDIVCIRQQLLLLQEALESQSKLESTFASSDILMPDMNESRLENVILEKETLAEANEELEKRVQELQDELNGLKNLENKLEGLKQKLASKNTLILELDELTMNLREELESLRNQTPSEANRFTKVECNFKETPMDFESPFKQDAVEDQLAKELQVLQAVNVDYCTEIEALKQKHCVLKAEIDNLRLETDSLALREDKQEITCRTCKEFSSKIEELEGKLGRDQVTHTERIQELQLALDEMVRDRERRQNQLEEKERALEQIRLKMTQLESLKTEQVLTLERELSEARQSDSERVKALQHALVEALRGGQQLEGQVDEKANLLEDIRAKLIELEASSTQHICALQEELDRAERRDSERVEALQGALNEANQGRDQLQDQLNEQTKLLENLRKEMIQLETLKAQHISSLEEDLARAKLGDSERTEALQRALDEAAQDIQYLRDQLDVKTKALEEIHMKVVELETLKAQQIVAFKAELAVFAKSNETLLEEANANVAEVEALKAVVAARERELNELHQLRDEITKIKSKVSDRETEWEKRFSTLTQLTVDLERSIEAKQSALSSIRLEFGDSVFLQAEMGKRDRLIAECEAELKELRQLKLTKEELQEDHEDLQRRYDNLCEVYDDKAVGYEEAFNEIISLNEKLDALQLDNKKLQKDLSASQTAQAVNEDSHKIVDALKEELAQAKAERIQLLAQLEAATAEQNSIAAKLNEREEEFQRLAQDRHELEQKSTAAKTVQPIQDRLIAECEAELKELRQLKLAKEELQEDHEDLQRRYDNLCEVYDDKAVGYEEAFNEIISLNEKLDALQFDNKKLQKDLSASQTAQAVNEDSHKIIDAHKEELAQAKAERIQLLVQLEAVTAEQNSIAAKLNEREEEFQRLAQDRHELEQKSTAAKTVQPIQAENCENLKSQILTLKREICRLNGQIATAELKAQNDEEPYQLRCRKLTSELARLKKQNSELKEEVRLLASRQTNEDNTVAQLTTKKSTKEIGVNTESKAPGCGWCTRLPTLENKLKEAKEKFEKLLDDYDIMQTMSDNYFVKLRKYRTLYYAAIGETEPPVLEVTADEMRERRVAARNAASATLPKQTLPSSSGILKGRTDNQLPIGSATGDRKINVFGSWAGSLGRPTSTTVAQESEQSVSTAGAGAPPKLYEMKAFTTSRSVHASLFDQNGLMKDTKEAKWKENFPGMDFLGEDEKKQTYSVLGNRSRPWGFGDINRKKQSQDKEQIENRPPK